MPTTGGTWPRCSPAARCWLPPATGRTEPPVGAQQEGAVVELTHHFEVPADKDTTWRTFNDLEEVVPCFPGATLTEVDGDEFTGQVKVKIGPISLTYQGTGRFVERDEDAGRIVLEASGKDRRGNGNAGATVTAMLSETADRTAVDESTELDIGGKPAQFGRGKIGRASCRERAEDAEGAGMA